MSSGDTTPTRANAVLSVGCVVVVAVLALVAAGCAQVPAGSGAEHPQSAPSTTGAAVTTTVADTTTTSRAQPTTTTTTLAEQSYDLPPKPEGEPDIELLRAFQIGDIVYSPEAGGAGDGEPLAREFVFEEVSGYSSYTVTSGRTNRSADESETFAMEGRVDDTSLYFAGIGDIGQPYEVIVSQDLEVWGRVDGEWKLFPVDYVGLVVLQQILPQVMHAILYDTFDTLTFADWDLIDGVWYARYVASAEFVAANLGYDINSEGPFETAGAVWVSPQGFMHSFEISATDTEREESAESTWRLSELGSTTVDLPEM